MECEQKKMKTQNAQPSPNFNWRGGTNGNDLECWGKIQEGKGGRLLPPKKLSPRLHKQLKLRKGKTEPKNDQKKKAFPAKWSWPGGQVEENKGTSLADSS